VVLTTLPPSAPTAARFESPGHSATVGWDKVAQVFGGPSQAAQRARRVLRRTNAFPASEGPPPLQLASPTLRSSAPMGRNSFMRQTVVDFPVLDFRVFAWLATARPTHRWDIHRFLRFAQIMAWRTHFL